MIVLEQLDGLRIKQYSDKNVWIRQKETGRLYEEAVDLIPCRFTYEETDKPIVRESERTPKEPEEDLTPGKKEAE